MVKKTLIAISGFKQSGKDTVATLIQQHAPTQYFQTVAFADPIKHAAMNILGLQDVKDWDTAKTQDVIVGGQPVSGRHVVREIGMLMRSYDEDQFTDYVQRHVVQPDTNWIITDMRFINELDWFATLRDACPWWNFVLVNVRRDGVTGDGHISEAGFPDDVFDVIIENNGTLEDLSDRVQSIVTL